MVDGAGHDNTREPDLGGQEVGGDRWRSPVSKGPRIASRAVMEALDLPAELRAVQDAYWLAEREWEVLDRAYRMVVSDVLKRTEPALNTGDRSAVVSDKDWNIRG